MQRYGFFAHAPNVYAFFFLFLTIVSCSARPQGLGVRETPYLIIADAMAATRADGVLGGRWESWLCNVHNSLSTLIGASTFALGSPAWRFACPGLGTGWAFNPLDWCKDNIGRHPIFGGTHDIVVSITIHHSEKSDFLHVNSRVTCRKW